MPMSRNRGSGSGPFLMEMVIAAGFFMLCVAMCLSAFVQADRLSKNGRDLNRAVLAAESLVEEVKAGNTEDFGNSVPDDNFQKIFEKWKTGDPDANAMYQSIESSEDIHTYQVVWDKEWNCYPDTGELEKNGKKLAYAGEIMTGMKDQMKEIAVVIFDYGTSTDHGSEIFHIFTEQYVKP